MVIAMVTYPCFIQPENTKKTRLDHFEEEIAPSWAVIQIRAANDKNTHALTCCGNAETLSHSAALDSSRPLWLVMGLLLKRVCWFIRLS